MLRQFRGASSVATSSVFSLAAASQLALQLRNIGYAPKPADTDLKLEKLKRSTWSWERVNGPMRPHRYYAHDPSSWNRAAAEKLEEQAGLGPDKLPIVHARALEREREEERRVNVAAVKTASVPAAAAAESTRSEAAPKPTPLARFPSVLASSNFDAAEEQDAAESTQEVCTQLCAATWDLLRRLLHPSALFLGKRVKATALHDLLQNALLLQDAALLLAREQQHGNNNSSNEDALIAAATLVVHSWTALRAVRAAVGGADAHDGAATLLSNEAVENLVAFVSGALPLFDVPTRVYASILLSSAAAASSVPVLDVLAPPDASTQLLTAELAKAENLDAVCSLLMHFAAEQQQQAHRSTAAPLVASLVVSLDFAASRFASRVATAHRSFQTASPDKGAGCSPVPDAIAVRWLVAAVQGMFSNLDGVEQRVRQSCLSHLQRVVGESLDLVLHLSPTRDVPLVQLIRAAADATAVAEAAAATEDEPQQQQQQKLVQSLQLLCVGVCKRHKAETLSVLSQQDLAKLLFVLAQPHVAGAANAVNKKKVAGGGDAEESSAADAGGVQLRNSLTRADYGALVRATIYCICTTEDGGLFDAEGCGRIVDVVADICDIAEAFEQFALDITHWRELVRRVAAASERSDGEQQQQQRFQQAKRQLLHLGKKHAVDVGGTTGHKVAVSLSKRDLLLVDSI